MKLKSYFSGTVEAAMELARKELGEEALLVNARPATPETRYLGAYEVVFGTEAEVARPPRSAADLPVGFPGPPNDRLAQEVAALKQEFERVTQSLLEAHRIELPPGLPSTALHARLIAQDLDPALAKAVEQGQPFEELFEVDATLGCPGDGRAIVALVGPPGAGKTTTLAKLAAHYGLASRKPVQILSTDVLRIGAADQLRSLASILGIGFCVAETAGGLTQMLEEHRNKELVFIDTPGLSRAEIDDAAELATLIASHPDIDTHLVLPAFMRQADMNRIIHRYSIFQPKKLLFTHVDETGQYGSLVSQAAAWSLPISFLGVGQQIPDDLEPAAYSRLADLILGARHPEQTSPEQTSPEQTTRPERTKGTVA
jgi:flagellar biosynthesis protein FlhF